MAANLCELLHQMIVGASLEESFSCPLQVDCCSSVTDTAKVTKPWIEFRMQHMDVKSFVKKEGKGKIMCSV